MRKYRDIHIYIYKRLSEYRLRAKTVSFKLEIWNFTCQSYDNYPTGEHWKTDNRYLQFDQNYIVFIIFNCIQ